MKRICYRSCHSYIGEDYVVNLRERKQFGGYPIDPGIYCGGRWDEARAVYRALSRWLKTALQTPCIDTTSVWCPIGPSMEAL